MRRDYTIVVYNWQLCLIPAVEAPIDGKSWAETLPPWRIQTMTYAEIHELGVRYWMAGQMLYEFGSGDKEELMSEARKWRK